MALQNPDTQTEQETPESGLRMDRVWFVREQQNGEPPTDPDWQPYSDHLSEFEASLDPALERIEGLGSPDPEAFGRALEENEVTVTYSLQQALVDGTGEPVDAAYDAFARNQASQIPNTHTMVARDNNPSPGPDDPDGASGQRRYLVLHGGKADASLEPDTTEADPVPCSLTYMGRKVRSYHIYQPDADELIAIESSSDADAMDVTIESEGAATAETVALNGTTPVTTEAAFGDIDAVWLSDDPEGDITVSINEGDATAVTVGSTLMELDGAQSYATDQGSTEGDRGVPALGAGSTPDPIGQPFEQLAGDIVDFDFPGNAPDPALNNITLEVDNNLEVRSRGSGGSPAVEEGNRSITIETDVIGERASHDMIRSAYLNRPSMLGWELSYTRFTFPESRCTEPPSPARAPDEAFAETAGTWSPGTIELENVE